MKNTGFQVSYVGPEDDLRMCVTIYYWEHDQSETRDIAEFFRGDANSLIQWQAPSTDMSVFAAPQPLPEDPNLTGSSAVLGACNVPNMTPVIWFSK